MPWFLNTGGVVYSSGITSSRIFLVAEDQQNFMNKGKVANLRIEYTDEKGLDRLRPLWLYLHQHHQIIAPSLGPYVDDDTSWTMRRRFYVDCLSHKGSFALLAYSEEDLVGYALVRVEPTSTMWSDTWVTGDRTAELETLVVAPDQRGRGVGALLLDRIESELGRMGIKDVLVGVLPANTEVLALYHRRGFEPTWLVMTRFSGRRQP
jgi:ribosomal protein S18 acetylase RimI-like enzyme